MTRIPFRQTKSRASTVAIGRSVTRYLANRLPNEHDCTDGRASSWVRLRPPLERSRAQAHRYRLRFLDLHSQRHGHVLSLLRDLRGSARADGGWAERTRPVRPPQRRDRNRIPSCVELYLRPRQYCGRRAQRDLVPDCHGLHVSAGILWLLTMMAQVFTKGFRPDIQRRILCFALFWHALDIIWIAVFTVVYLLGSAQ